MILLEICRPAPRLSPEPHGGCHGQISSDLIDLQGLQTFTLTRSWALCKPSWTAPKWANQLSYSLSAFSGCLVLLGGPGFNFLGLQAISFTRQAGRCFPQVHGAWCITRYLGNVNNHVTTQGEKKNLGSDVKNVTFHLFTASWHLKDAILQGIQVREAAAIVLLHRFETCIMIAKKGKSKKYMQETK